MLTWHLDIILYSYSDDYDKYVFHMQKNAKKYGKCGLVWGNIRKKTVSMFIIYRHFYVKQL